MKSQETKMRSTIRERSPGLLEYQNFELLAWGQNKNGELGLQPELTTTNTDADVAVCTPTRVKIAQQPLFIASGNEHSFLITKTNKILACGNSNNNTFCDKDQNQFKIYNLRSFRPIKKEILQRECISFLTTGATHQVALTTDGRVLAWGGSFAENLSKRKSRLYDEAFRSKLIQDLVHSKGLDLSEKDEPVNTELLMPLQNRIIS